MSETKLLPCPFCGGEAEVNCDSRFDDWFIRCTKCFCKTRTFKTERSAILIWNNRKPMKRIVERLEEKHEELRIARIKTADKSLIDEVTHIWGQTLLEKQLTMREAIDVVKEEGGISET